MIGLLQARATSAPRAAAMWHHARGQWLGWRWEDILADVSALAGALHARGIGAGGRVILASEPRPEALITVLACDWLGAAPVAAGAPFAVAETAEDADALRAAGHGGAVVLIEPLPGAIGLAALIAEAPAPPPPPAGSAAAGQPPLHGFCQASLLDPAEIAANILPLLRDGGTLSFPERPGTAAADLAVVRPERFSATAAQWEALREDLGRRVPPGRFGWPFAARRLRRQLGLDRARLLIAHGGTLAPETAGYFAGIGLTLTEIATDAVPR